MKILLKIVVIPGDGIGKEVVPESIRVLKAISDINQSIEFEESPYSCNYYLEHGTMMPDDAIEKLAKFDSIFLGAVGDVEKVPDHISLWGLLIKLRREFQQEINIRPAKLLDGIKSKLTNPPKFDLLVIRENSEGEYSSVGGRIFHDENEIADFILKNPLKFKDMTTEELAKSTYSSPATIVRLSQKSGAKNYNNFKIMFLKEYMETEKLDDLLKDEPLNADSTLNDIINTLPNLYEHAFIKTNGATLETFQ
ncbi:isocitrate/isopropylmalate family dehydrogenase [Staphylococcus epidermidis]|uniref:isocitrate/isopropylmalate family dehydrogenase n=1 Tax=Staphylococcus epidermidis TaxID=1282 RepID=UPI002887D3C6|nr:isocitrate/isopropylmalate family dehydrogenase [Staphylococcus epidermidis]MDT0652613.1 isocitrate/isopropylmalate family dehydrogenase [Staphylococcus epidermidis]